MSPGAAGDRLDQLVRVAQPDDHAEHRTHRPAREADQGVHQDQLFGAADGAAEQRGYEPAGQQGQYEHHGAEDDAEGEARVEPAPAGEGGVGREPPGGGVGLGFEAVGSGIGTGRPSGGAGRALADARAYGRFQGPAHGLTRTPLERALRGRVEAFDAGQLTRLRVPQALEARSLLGEAEGLGHRPRLGGAGGAGGVPERADQQPKLTFRNEA
ncbi:hypothetical protein ACIQWN_13280 [Streptomyces vinaceus]|uniref:hypothetical protein n=1 Tax=Streptomyces vinaceus TaxID=1960 RepID=UPI003818ED1C